jgi:hypothetical protein
MVWKGDTNNRLAKSLVTLIDQIDQRFPSRDKHNDGTIGDNAHQKRKSDHNPRIRNGSMGVVTALDIAHDPASGFDAGEFAESLREVKDPRIKYVIFDGRIFNSTESPWVWRKRNQGPGDHSEHVHISVVADPTHFDDVRQWSFDLSNSVPGQAAVSRPNLKRGDRGPAVIDLQNLLGVAADGEFGPETEQAVRAFQASRNILVDGVVGSHTWGALTASLAGAAGGNVGSLSPTTIKRIIKLADESDLARVRWSERGIAPRGYIRGMAVTFGQVYAKWKAGDSAARVMAAMNSGNDHADALSRYDSRFREAGMDNAAAGPATLRHLFVLLIGLGMRESSGRYCEGRDTEADNVTADTAEAGLFQMSWNARTASPELPKLFAAYSAKPDGFLSIFQEGVAPRGSDLENFGVGEGVAFQRLCKTCPAFAVEAAGVGLRVRCSHWGPIKRREAEIRPEADTLLEQVQAVIDATVFEPVPDIVLPPFKLPTKLQPPAGNPLLLILLLIILSKEKAMAGHAAKPLQGVDLGRVLLPLLLQSVVSGKRIDTTDLLSVLLTGKPSVVPTSAPTPPVTPQHPTGPTSLLLPQQPTDPTALLLPLLYQVLSDKPWPWSDATPVEPVKPAQKTETSAMPAMSKPSVQLGVAGLGLGTILQALGIVGTPFGMGDAPTQIGTLATLVPMATAAIGATGGFGALLNIGRTLFGGFSSAASQGR